MDASRLLAVVGDIESEYQGDLSQLLKDLIQQYTTARDSPSVDNTAAIQTALSALVNSVNQSAFLNYPPSKAALLDSIKGANWVGPGFLEHLNEILSVPGQTTAGIVTGLTKLQADLEAFRKACAQAKAGLESLGVMPYAIPQGEFQVGVLIPGRVVDFKLGAFAKELEIWNKILRGFQELAGEDEREVTVRSLASSGYEVYLPLGMLAAGLLSRTIDKLLDWYLRILEIRKRRQELHDLGAPVAETNAIKKHERDFLETEIRALAEQLVKEAHPKVEAIRRQELETHITLSIRQIARFVDKGGTVEVDSTRPEEPTEPVAPTEGADTKTEVPEEYGRLMKEFTRLNSEFEKVSRILDDGMCLRRLPDRPEPILQLTEAEPEGDSTESEKTAKKRS
jgi:hypothetical protein